jgi:hypothetical protein
MQIRPVNTVMDFTYGTLYDSTLWTFPLMNIIQICEVWKDLEKMQRMSSISAFYLKLFKNGD